MRIKWSFLGGGSYNEVYINKERTLVLKIQKNNAKTDDPERSVRLWNEINPNCKPKAYVVITAFGKAWVCPFIKGRQATDDEMSEAIIDIYNNTGRIVVDATAKNNFITTPEGKVLCIDIGMALELEKKEERSFSGIIRRNSIVSLKCWRDLQHDFDPFFEDCQEQNPKSVNTVKALLCIKNNRPDIFDINFLKTKRSLIYKLAEEYDIQKNTGSNECSDSNNSVKKMLNDIRSLTFKNSKQSCVVELNRYIASRGSIKDTGDFSPSVITRFFRKHALTEQKVKAALGLMTKIKQSDSAEEINKALTKITKGMPFDSKFTKGLERSIAKCSVIMATYDAGAKDQLQSSPKIQ